MKRKEMNVDFIGNTNRFLAVSGALILIIAAFLVFFGLDLDIQFKGGSIVTYSYSGEIDTAEFQDTVQGVLGGNASAQHSRDISTGLDTIVVSYAGSIESERMIELNDAVYTTFPDRGLLNISANNVAPVIGQEFLVKCMIAIGVAFVLMLLYVAVRFRKIGGLSAGAMAIVALVHDVIILFGVFVLFRLPIDDNFIAAVLTILGFSLNDTIVIYDRIRENRHLSSSMSLAETVNLSINQSFSRSVVTSVATIVTMIIVTIVAYLNNVDSILSFSFPMILGLISGSYSTICIAGPLWVRWRNYSTGTPKKAV